MKSVIFFLMFLFSLTTNGQTPANDPHWQLLWEDNFNSLNPDIWLIENDCDHFGEPQLYKTNNVTISNGNLVLTVKQEQTNVPTSWCNSANIHYYTSGAVQSSQAYNTQYGFIEAKIYLPYGYGFWPAFWTFVGAGISGTNAAEIDIFEMLGSQPSTTAGTNIHKNYSDPNDPMPSDYFFVGSYAYSWHTYAIEWSPSKIIWYVDGYPARLAPNHGIVDPVRIILNLAIEPGALPNSSTPFPSEMLVDYVRVYELKKDCNNFINSCNYDFSSYDNKLKNFIKIGEGGCSNSIPVGSDIILRASQFIEITGDFEVPIGASFYADANQDCDISSNCSNIFKPCSFNFANYYSTVKKEIELGGNGCSIVIIPTNNSISLEATDKIVLKPGVKITSTPNNFVKLKISTCY